MVGMFATIDPITILHVCHACDFRHLDVQSTKLIIREQTRKD